MDRYQLMMEKYAQLDTVNGGVLLTVAWLAGMGIMLDQLVTGKHRPALLTAYWILVLVVDLSLLVYAGILNGV